MPSESVSQRIAELHRQAKDSIDWLSIPGAAERAGIREPRFIIMSLKVLLASCTVEESLDDLEALLNHLKCQAVAA